MKREMLCHTSNQWDHRNCKQKFTKISGNNTTTTLNRSLTENCHTRNIIRKGATIETWSLRGAIHHWLKRRSTREERKPVTRNDDDNNNNNNNNNNSWIIKVWSRWEMAQQSSEPFFNLVLFPRHGYCCDSDFMSNKYCYQDSCV
jgi:hypothetical protein